MLEASEIFSVHADLHLLPRLLFHAMPNYSHLFSLQFHLSHVSVFSGGFILFRFSSSYFSFLFLSFITLLLSEFFYEDVSQSLRLMR